MILDFYTTLGCHLCEEALLLLEEASLAHDFKLVSVEISEDERLVERYGVSIPVVANSLTKRELYWPFDKVQLENFLSLGKEGFPIQS